MKFKVGDVVVVRKPQDRHEHPVWTKEMDEYNGKEGVVKTVKERDWGQLICLDFPDYWLFSNKWCTLVDDFYGNV